MNHESRIAAALVAAVLLLAAPAEASTGGPSLHRWQAKRIAYGYAIQQQRPAYRVVAVTCRKRRCRVIGHEPGYLCEVGDCEPDVTTTLVERRGRRGCQFWVRDPLAYFWRRWL